ncbi:AraC family transcriptional regulator [Sphingobacterium paludis]|uniref:AraC family transcriptional regulator n=1 Tax=Sphingobacterium paludis TaxID=1476465 RepID=A0A4R7CZ80_9SPHI|nr:AraC family transcriptional regulator [Sphingobacterium paludis]TDS13222.1 AraC family transcriptional regulator [Sphingobacterium paludis]
MQKATLHEPYSISFETWAACPIRDHTHHFFELVYILSGTGEHQVDGHTFKYEPGHLFLITPQASHHFDVATVTDFFFLRFSNIYLKNNVLQHERIKQLDYILQNAAHKPGCLLKSAADRQLIDSLIQHTGNELKSTDFYKREVIQQCVDTLIVLIARNIADYIPSTTNEQTDERVISLLTYIQNHIYEPEKIRTDALCAQFGVSANYLGRYFKKQCGETMQSYIIKYKTTLITHRLKHSDKRINEIAAEFGFTDESHLNKFFKQQHGVSPKIYRKLNTVRG